MSNIPLAEVLGGELVVLLPSLDGAAPTSYMAGVEVMVQQGIGSFAWDVSDWDASAELRSIYASRAVFGVYRFRDTGQARDDFAFVLADTLAVSGAVSAPVILPAMTPTEVLAAAGAGAGVCVYPAETLGVSYAGFLREVAPRVPLLARGGLSAFAAGKWLEHGAAACLDEVFLSGALSGGSLSDLRYRCRSYREQVPQA